jgi:glycine betaine/choline ABC-type transport system substrate-binding protein
VRGALEALSGSITAGAMRRMNAAVDRDRRRPEDVAREFLLRGRDR